MHNFETSPRFSDMLIAECQNEYGTECGFESAILGEGILELKIEPRVAVRCIAKVCHFDSNPHKIFAEDN